MTNSRRFVMPQLLVPMLVMVMTAPYAAAAPYTWTTSGSGGVRTDGAGTWNTSALNWTTTGTGVAVAWPNLTTDVAVFGAGSGTAGTVTVSTVSTNGITFNQPGSGSYLLSGGTITLGGSSPTITTAAGVSARIASSLAGTTGLATTGGGTLTLSGSSAVSGTATFALGEVILASGAALPSLSGLNIGSGIGSATLRVQSGATLTLTSGSANIIGSETRTLGTVVQEGGVVSIGGSQGSLVLSTNGGVTTYSGSASYVLQGGTLALTDTTNGFISVGRNATATFTQSGGVVTVARTSDATTIGDYATGSYAVSGGSFTAASTSANALLGNRGGAGTLTVSGSGSFGIGGSMFLAVNANNLASAKGSATVNLQGGTLAVNGMSLGRAGTTGANGPGTATFNFSGGTLRPYSANTSIGSATAANNFAIDVSGTGATLSGIDLASSTVRRLDVYATLQGGGDITVAGGTVSLSAANTYAGATTIAGTNTTLALAANGSFASSGTITVGNAGSSGAILDLTAKSSTFAFGSGQRVQGIGTINIGAGKTVSSAGIWAPGNSIGSNTVTGNLTLTGTSQFEMGGPGTSLTSTGTSDFTSVSGTLTLGGKLTLLDNAGANSQGSYGAGAYRLFTAPTVSGTFASVTTPAGVTTSRVAMVYTSGTSSGQGVFANVYNLAVGSVSSGTTVNLGLVHAGGAFMAQGISITNAAAAGSFSEGLNATVTGSTGNAASGGTAITNLVAGGTSSTITVNLADTATGGVKNGTLTIGYQSNGSTTSGLAIVSAGSQVVNLTGSVFSGSGVWNVNGGGSWGTGANANWTSPEAVAAAPGTFAGYADVDTARFASALTSGTASIKLNGAQVSLASITFNNTIGRYVIESGTGSGALTLASASGKPVIDVVGIHQVATAISGTSGLEKTGLGTLVLSGSSNYSGGTDITAGTLAVNGFLGGAVNVANAAILGGTGTLNGVVTVAAGGIVAPGNSPGILTFDGGTAVLAGTTQIEIFGATRGTGYDAIDLMNGATLNYGNGVLALDLGSWLADQQSYQLFGSGSSTLSGHFSSVTIAGTNYTGLTFAGSNGVWTSQGTSPAGQTLRFTEATGVLVIVPEPAAIGLAGLGIGLAGWAAGRRRRLAS